MYFCYGSGMRADRLVSILLLLQVKGRLTARALAERLEVSERTILRDMDALSSAGVPLTADRGVGGGWQLLDGYETKLTGLTAPEIRSLFFARPPKVLADLGLGESAEAAWLKLEAALPGDARRHAEFVRERILIDPRGWRDSSDSVASLPVLLDGVWRERQLRFLYESGLGEPGERLVDPLGLVARGRTWYLIASRTGELRTYRVSRIKNARVEDSPSRRPEGFDLATYWEQSAREFREHLPRYYATFLVEPSVLRWVRYRGWRLEEEVAQGERVRIRLRFDAEEEGLQFGLSFGADVAVIEPVQLRDKVRAEAERLVRSYK
jgi:predicted DNA-binding transcriptional regulator YafY